MHIAVIATMKRGLEHFVYRELLAFTEQGITISLFPTKFELGLYNARSEWMVRRWNGLAVILLQPYYFIRHPLLYLRLLAQAVCTGALVDFFLAWHFAPRMAEADVIYATFGDHKLFIGYFCKQILGKPLAVTIHAYELYQNPNPRLFPLALSACDRVVTVTEYNKELLVSDYSLAPSSVEVIRCGVDLEEYRPGKKFAILMVAFFAERKGHEILFKALRQLDRDDIEAWIVGDEGSEQPVDVRGLARELGVESRVAFFGRLGGNSLKALFRACDVFCLPCRQDSEGVSEGFPAAIIEAMAFGKPVISTRHVEIPRVIDEVLVPENDPESLARAIEHVLRDAELRRRLGEKNRRIAEEVFSGRNAVRSAQLFQELAARGAGRPGEFEPASERRRVANREEATARR